MEARGRETKGGGGRRAGARERAKNERGKS